MDSFSVDLSLIFIKKFDHFLPMLCPLVDDRCSCEY